MTLILGATASTALGLRRLLGSANTIGALLCESVVENSAL